MNAIRADQTLSDLAVTCSGAWQVFYKHRLDYCYHGDVSLKAVCDRQGIDCEEMIEEIRHEAQILDEPFDRWDEKPLEDLMGHISEHFHVGHRGELPGLIESARQVEKAYSTRHLCPNGLQRHLSQMSVEIERHVQKEERILFPLIRGLNHTLPIMSIHIMAQENLAMGEHLDRLRDLTHQVTVPENANVTWRTLYSSLIRFEEGLLQHMHLENNVLFPRALSKVAE